jgi:hypothetical protein
MYVDEQYQWLLFYVCKHYKSKLFERNESHKKSEDNKKA